MAAEMPKTRPSLAAQARNALSSLLSGIVGLFQDGPRPVDVSLVVPLILEVLRDVADHVLHAVEGIPEGIYQAGLAWLSWQDYPPTSSS
jgi:hypothetical protein